MVEYAAISVIALVLGFVLGYAVRAAISARKRRVLDTMRGNPGLMRAVLDP